MKLFGTELLNPPNRNIVSAYITPSDLNFLYFKVSLIAYFFRYRIFQVPITSYKSFGLRYFELLNFLG